MSPRPLSCAALFKLITEVFEARTNKDLQEHGVTLSQMKVLVSLDQTEGHAATLKELERFFDTSQATMAGLAARLEKKGLVDSYIDPEDRRIKHIRLSEQGESLCRDAREKIEAGERWLVQSLAPEEWAQLQRLLQRVYEHIK